MRYFKVEEENKALAVVELLKEYGYEYARYYSDKGNFDDLTIGSSPNKYMNLRFDSHRGFYVSTTGTWVVGEDIKKIEREAILVNEIYDKITELLK